MPIYPDDQRFDGENMFGLFKSKGLAEKEARIIEIGKVLFKQISVVRDKVNTGQLDKGEVEHRINSMYTAGYLIGYIDEHLDYLFIEEKSKSKYAKRILKGIFPRSGIKFVQSKLAARRLGDTIDLDDYKGIEVHLKRQEFDLGISAARYEVSECAVNEDYTPNKLTLYLSTGKVK